MISLGKKKTHANVMDKPKLFFPDVMVVFLLIYDSNSIKRHFSTPNQWPIFIEY